MKIENAKETFFNSKDEYLQFIQAWKQFHAEGKHKKVEFTEYDGSIHMKSNLHCEHHLLYNLLRGKDISKMFKATDKHTGQGPFWAFEEARDAISWATRTDRTKGLLAPFAGTIDKDTLSAVTEKIQGWSL